MTVLPKIEPSELVTKYELHPEAMDIFVEGEFDKDFLLNYLSSRQSDIDATILPIDCVNIQADSSNSNKEAIISLSVLIENELKGIDISSIFIIDADSDRLRNKILSKKYLYYTDFTCMEMYLYNSSTLKKFLSFTCNLNDTDRDDFVNLAENILPYLFLARAINEELSINIGIPSFFAGLKKKGKLDTFSHEKYLSNYFSLISSASLRDSAKTACDHLIKSLPIDLRDKAHGHDFISLLFEFLWTQRSLKLHSKDDDVVRFGGRILGTAVNISEISQHTLFKRLDTKVAM